MNELIHQHDKYKMNWVDGNTEWGTVKLPEGLSVEKEKNINGDITTESYTFMNTTNKDLFTSLRSISIYTPFNDNYEKAEVCMTNKCHTHIWCGGEVSYIMALRMGGEAPHLGLVLTKGSLGGYSIERDLTENSNDRGDFILHPSPISLMPGESFTIEWKLFWHDGKEDFYKQLKNHNPNYIQVYAEDYVVFKGEKIKIYADNKLVVDETADLLGEHTYPINKNGITTNCNILVLPKLHELAKARCYFIAEKQQFHKPASRLDGAYLTYDNEDKYTFYSPKSDYNAVQERVCMGILISRYLRNNKDVFLNESLLKYLEFLRREIIDEETGEVCNDYQHDRSYKRLYNFPWKSVLYLELYHLYNNIEYLKIAFKIMRKFYEEGGGTFYAIEIPVAELVVCLEKENLSMEKDEILNHFKAHGDFMIEKGTNYPAHEVKFEQSIVAPATSLLIQLYQVTNEQKYLDGAKKQMAVLELFNANQPCYHMNEVAIRHWDGFWFGKKKLYGDTYPHYWSSLTGNVYNLFAKVLNDKNYAKKAKDSLRATLSMFNPDGSASAAYVYPVSVNGVEGRYYDPYANDQDWGLYFMLRYIG